MAEWNPYFADSLRVVGNEIHWGETDCLACNGRGWHMVQESFVDHEEIDADCCSCSPVHTEEDMDRLKERLFMLAHFYELMQQSPPEEEDLESIYDVH